MPLLELHDLSAAYGAVEALKGLSLQVGEGEIVALLGSNGAGKSTTLRTISGLMKPKAGRVLFDGQDIGGMHPESVVRLGVAHVPEGRRVFPGLTVKENIMLGASNRRGVARRQLETEVDGMFELFPEIRRFSGALGWTLSGGQQQMVALARGLMSKPRLLLLDEPSLGLAPLIVQQVFRIITRIRERGTTVLLVEQNARTALSVADRGYVLETGRLIIEGKPDALWNNDEVRAAYLGGRVTEGAGAKADQV
jgi:branched-chain amino acid transport system ATP-binding protein